MAALSILDLVRVTQSTDARGALDNARDLAAHAEKWGYQRFWVAEHHNMPGIASAATSVRYRAYCGGLEDHPRRRGRHHASQPMRRSSSLNNSEPSRGFFPAVSTLGSDGLPAPIRSPCRR